QEFRHILVAEQNGVSSLPPDGSPVLLDFDLTAEPLPLWATDVHLYVLFSRVDGQGKETRAWGYLDCSEPTPVLVYNNLDRSCLSGSWQVSGSPEAVALVDGDGNGIADPWEFDVYPDNLRDIRVRLSPADTPTFPAGDLNDISIDRLNAGESFRFYLITDPSFTLATNQPLIEHAHEDDRFTTPSFPAQAMILPSRNHQTELLEPDLCLEYGQQPPCYGVRYGQTSLLREEMYFDLLLFSKPNYPDNATCSLDDLE
ncbi:MAG: hypothetical protein ACOCVU_07485, partial [Desulfohalobiaceae bacterium]